MSSRSFADNADVLERHSHNEISESSEDTIISRFERQVAGHSDNLAIVTEQISLSYRALDQIANHIAAALLSLSSQHDRPIVLFMQNDAARVAAMLGVLKASRIFIPVAPDSPEKWLTQVFEDSGAAEIIVDNFTQRMANLAAGGNVNVLEVDRLAQSHELLVAKEVASPDETAYVVYTSGSTGRPKGVANTHRSLIRRGDVRSSLFGLRARWPVRQLTVKRRLHGHQ